MAKRLYFQKAFALAIFTVLQLTLFAQTAPLPLNHNYTNLYEHSLHHLSSQVHTDFKPFNQFQLSSIRDSVIDEMITDENKTWLGRKLFNEHLVNLEKPDYSLYVDPAIEFRIGKEANNGKTLFTNTRGFTLSGTIGKKFAFSSDFYENQALFPTYINNWIKENRQKKISRTPKTVKKTKIICQNDQNYCSKDQEKDENRKEKKGKKEKSPKPVLSFAGTLWLIL